MPGDHFDPAAFCPYVGLRPFEASHADYFFGRGADSADIADHFLARSITVLYGGSGVGKSSVVNIGVARALAELHVVQTPQIFREWFSPTKLMEWLSKATANAGSRLLLIFDQFEEFFLYRDSEEIEKFSKELRLLLRRPEPDVHILFALRDDALHLLNAISGYLPQIYDTRLELRHFDEASLREAIEGPLRVYNDRFRKENPIRLNKDLVDYLVDKENWSSGSDVNKLQPHGRVELPFLQLALTKLWYEEGGGQADELRVETLRTTLQGIAGIATRHVEEKLAALSRSEQRTASKILHYLVTPSGGKIAYSQDDLKSYTGSKNLPRLLDKLTGERILRGVQAGIEATGGARYELFHDKLAEPLLKWRAKYLEEGPFACLLNLFSGKEFELHGFAQLFGRLTAPEDDMADDPMSRREISRNHLIVLSNFDLLDLRSVNGTTVNAIPVALGEPRRLETGDIVVLANFVPFVFFSIEDEERVNGIPPPEARGAWAAVIDGVTRTVDYVTAPEAGLRLEPNNQGVRVVRADEPSIFAKLSIQRDPFLAFKPHDRRPELSMVAFRDSYHFPRLPVTSEFLPEIPEEWKAAARGSAAPAPHERLLFVIDIDDLPFEIVLVR